MEKLYPPYINGTIPAFYYSEGATKIVVPFTMNRAVQAGDVAGFALKIKNISGDVKCVEQDVDAYDISSSNASVTFSSKETFVVGQYYKAQLAYISSNGVIGYYSTVGIIKCTTRPKVEIEGLAFGQANMHQYSYTGVYSQYGGDATEKMYSYRFLLTDVNGNVIADSDEKIHSTSTDDLPYESHETFAIKKEFSSNSTYYLQFIATTVNKLTVSSVRYRLVPNKTVPPDINVSLNAVMDFNNGYTFLTMTPLDESTEFVSGNFVLCRASNEDNYAWEEIQRFDFHAQSIAEWRYKDFTVEQGKIYKYSIQQYNAQGIYSDRIETEEVAADFEDMFLFDGKKQLRIRYNPKVSSFKTTLLEVKTDTIGSKYPFFSRNGNVEYKEFTISGLLSYFVDEDENFISMQDLGLDGFFSKDDPFGKYRTTNIVDYNIMAERIFKNIVLDWLNDGRVKLFKSPAEGNYLVRLMNVSLTPMDQLSRMLHTFNATAYEVADFNSDNLVYYGFINPEENLETSTGFKGIDIASAVQVYLKQKGKTLDEAIGDKVVLTTQPANMIDIKDALPGSYFYIGNEKIQIGTTGAYHYVAPGDEVIGNISYVIGSVNEGQTTYGYKTQAITLFGTVQDIQMLDYPDRQFIGREYLNNCRIWNSENSIFESSTNLLDMIRDVRTTVLSLNAIKAERRNVEYLYSQNMIENLDNYSAIPLFWDENCQEQVDWSKVNPLDIFRIRIVPQVEPYNTIDRYKYYVDANYDEFSKITDICIDGNTKEVFTWSDDLFNVQINEEVFNLSDSIPYKLLNTSEITVNYLEPQKGVVIDLMYVVQIQTFIVETEKGSKYSALKVARNDYLNEQYEMIKARKIGAYDTTAIKNKYLAYLYELNKALDNYKEENGLVE